MNRLFAALTCSALVAGLCACQRPASEASAPASVAAASGGAGAVDDGLAALTRAAFPSSKDDGLVVLHVPAYLEPESPIAIGATPEMVVKVDATHRALVMSGTPSDESGHEYASHAQGGNLGVYGFALRDGRWVRTTTQDSVLWSGSHGHLGAIKPVDLGDRHMAVSVEGGFTGQGYNVSGLDIVALDPSGARVVLSSLQLHTDSRGVAEGCDEWIDKGQVPSATALAELTPENCFDVTGTWRVEPGAGAAFGDIVVTFGGLRLVVDPVTKLKSLQAVAGTLTYRYSNGGYVKASGENLTPDV